MTTFTTSTTVHTLSLCPPGQDRTVTQTETFGPADILIGDNQSQICFVPIGAMDFNTNTDTTTLVCGTAPAPALPRWGYIVLGVALLGLGVCRRIIPR